MASKLPYSYGGTVDFEAMWAATGYQEYEDFNGDGGGYILNYPDNNNNGYADFYDDYIEYGGDPSIILKPSQGHAGT